MDGARFVRESVLQEVRAAGALKFMLMGGGWWATGKIFCRSECANVERFLGKLGDESKSRGRRRTLKGSWVCWVTKVGHWEDLWKGKIGRANAERLSGNGGDES